jgi:hypothetical protein
MHTLELVKKARPKPLREAAPSTPEAVSAIVQRCLAQGREERFQSAADLERAVTEHMYEQRVVAGAAELREFVASLGAAPAQQPRDIDEALQMGMELPPLEGGSRTLTGPSAPPAPAQGTPVAPTGSTIAGPGNRLVLTGLVGIIAVLLFFNIWNIVSDRTRKQGGALDEAGTRQAAISAAARSDKKDRAHGQPAPAATHEEMTAPAPAPPLPVPAVRLDAKGGTPEATVRGQDFIEITGVPDGATLAIAGTEVSLTPDNKYGRPPGDLVLVEVEKPHFKPFAVEIGREVKTISVEMEPERRTVRVLAEPPQAVIVADGRELGPPPQEVRVQGDEVVRVQGRLSGYTTDTAHVSLESGHTVTLRLEPESGASVTFRPVPADAVVHLDGLTITAPSGGWKTTTRSLKPGPHQVEIDAGDHKGVPVRFSLKPGESLVLGQCDSEGCANAPSDPR